MRTIRGRYLSLGVCLVVVAALLVGSCSKTDDTGASKGTYVASKIREPFHKADCEWASRISPENLVTYSSREEAIQAGHRPCKVCRP